MGNRTVVVMKSMPEVGIYLHWGMPADVEGIVDKAKEYARSPGDDPQYSFARLCEQAIEWAGAEQETGIGIGLVRNMDQSHLVTIGDNWEIT